MSSGQWAAPAYHWRRCRRCITPRRAARSPPAIATKSHVAQEALGGGGLLGSSSSWSVLEVVGLELPAMRSMLGLSVTCILMESDWYSFSSGPCCLVSPLPRETL